MAEAIAKATYKDANGRRAAEPEQVAGSTSWARSTTPGASPGKAVDYYKQVAERFSDAAGAVRLSPART